jgi:hypothetical protein
MVQEECTLLPPNLKAKAFRHLSYLYGGKEWGEMPALCQKHTFTYVLQLFLSLGIAITAFKAIMVLYAMFHNLHM